MERLEVTQRPHIYLKLKTTHPNPVPASHQDPVATAPLFPAPQVSRVYDHPFCRRRVTVVNGDLFYPILYEVPERGT